MLRLSCLPFALLLALPAPAQEASAVVGSVAPQHRATDFVLDVLPWLQVEGCATAKCHGGSGGRGGLHFSLFGSDPRADHLALTALDDGRRLDFVVPERSLLLRKPTRDLPHRGGARFAVGDPAWQVLRDWVAAGAPWRPEQPAAVVGLRAELDGDRLAALATLRRGDGSTVDEALGGRVAWSSSAPSVATVDVDGRLELHGPGVAAIFARFGSRSQQVWEVVVPFAEQQMLPGRAAHRLDRAHRAALAELGVAPVDEVAPDWLLLRRLTLDLAGRLPRPAELREFAAADPARRVAEVAAALLATDDFVTVQTERLAELLDIARPAAERDGPPQQAAQRGRQALRSHLESGAALDDLVRRLVRLGGPWLTSADARDRAERTAQGLLGLRIGCARCHDHPLDRWRQIDHQAFAALFTDPRPPEDTAGARPGLLFDDRGQPVARGLLDLGDGGGRDVRSLDVLDGTTVLREFLTEDPAARRQLARHFANHVLATLFGEGLVDPVDDHRATNPARLAPVLDAATDELLARDLDLRGLFAWIVDSELYQRRALHEGDPAAAADLLIARPSREMPPWLARRSARLALLGTAPDSPDSAPASPLTDQLDGLHGMAFLAAVNAPGSALELLAAVHDPAAPDATLDELFLLLWSRSPSAAERAATAATLRAAPSPALGLRQVAFALCNARAFRFCR